MELDLIFHNSDHSDFGKTRVQNLIYKSLLCLQDYEFKVVHPLTLDIEMSGSSGNLKSMLMFTILNKANNKAILINLSDRLEPNLMENHGFDSFDIVQIIGGMSIEKQHYENYKEKLDSVRKPLMIPVDRVYEDDYLLSYTKNPQKKIKKAVFIGNIYGGRSEIVDILKTHPLFDIKHMIREEGHPFKEYIEELQKYSVGLSLNGYAEICYRDIECMATYVPTIRSEYSNKYYNEIIPDYHYIVGSEASCNGFLAYNKPTKDIADQFIDRMEKIIDNEELLENISKNGRVYYENNCTLNKIAQNAMELINLNLLK